MPRKTHLAVLALALAATPPCAAQDHTRGNAPDSAARKGVGIVRESVNRDTLRPDTTLHAWRYRHGWQRIEARPDTAQLDVIYHDPARPDTYYPVSLGNLGQPTLPASFHQRRNDPPAHWSMEGATPFLARHHRTLFYDTKTPFTRLHYAAGPQEWLAFHFLHTQNITRDVSFGVTYNSYTSEGHYIYQDTRLRTGSFWLCVKDARYRNKTSLNFNALRASHNGGVAWPQYITDSVGADPTRADTRLSGAGSRATYHEHQIDHEYSVLRRGAVDAGALHTLSHATLARHYHDPASTAYTLPLGGGQLDYYANHFAAGGSDDSLSKKVTRNDIGLFASAGERFRLRGEAFARNELERYQNHFVDTLFAYANDTVASIWTLNARLTGHAPRLGLWGAASIQWAPWGGFRHGDFRRSVEAGLRHRALRDTATLAVALSHNRATADWLLNHYSSNHYKWQTRRPPLQTMSGSATWRLRHARLALAAQYDAIVNMPYIDPDRQWRRQRGTSSVVGASVEKSQRLGRFFELSVKALYQAANDTLIDLPALTAKARLVFDRELNFRATGGVARLQIGVDCWYYTAHYLPDYDPALGMFVMQRGARLGGHPFVDLFASVRIKRMVLFVRGEHLNSLATGLTYFDAYGYPSWPATVKYGLSWTFYD